MDDLISRQDAIRIVDSIDTWQAGWRGNAIESLKAMPSAQPERTGIGNNIGYADSVCPNCGRQRVEKYESGLEICEKCHWCIQTSNFWWWEVEHE